MIVRVLGSAAGGGVPQWNCSCSNCAAVRAGRQPARTQSSLAISADGRRWLLVNCSPDVAGQIEAFPPLHPPAPRGTPIAGMLLTDANVDHLGGMAVLRQAGLHRFLVRSSGAVRALAVAQPAFAAFARLPHDWLEVPLDRACEPAADDDIVGTQLVVRAIAVPGTTPGFDGRRQVHGAVVAYEVTEKGSEERVLFAPVFAGIDAALAQSIASASLAFLDGTFFSDDELGAQGLPAKTAPALGHQPVGGDGGTLAQLRDARARVIFTHVNNTNPMLDPDSVAHALVCKAGAEVAYDGMEFTI